MTIFAVAIPITVRILIIVNLGSVGCAVFTAPPRVYWILFNSMAAYFLITWANRPPGKSKVEGLRVSQMKRQAQQSFLLDSVECVVPSPRRSPPPKPQELLRYARAGFVLAYTALQPFTSTDGD